MRMLLIANPGSGTGTDADAMAGRLRALGGDGAEVVVAGIDELDGLNASSPKAAGVERVVAAGGDGTLGPAAALAADLGVPLAVVPTGTANDLARSLALPLDDLEAAFTLAATGTRRRHLDIAYAGDGVPFLNAAASGLSVHATRRAEPLKQRLGPLAYAAGALHAGLRAAPGTVRVRVDGTEVHAGDAWQVIVAGTGAFGGGSELEEAQEGGLDVAVVCASSSRLRRAALVRRAYGMRQGGLTDQSGVVSARGREVIVEGPEQFNVDGEVRSVRGGRFTLGSRVAIIVP